MLRNLVRRLKEHEGLAIDLIRIMVGATLIVRGGIFLTTPSTLLPAIEQYQPTWIQPTVLVYAITLTHLVGGLLLVAGLFTRWAAVAQLPILLGTLFIVPLEADLYARSQTLELKILMLFLLLLVFIFGAGKPSLDAYYFGRTFRSVSAESFPPPSPEPLESLPSTEQDPAPREQQLTEDA